MVLTLIERDRCVSFGLASRRNQLVCHSRRWYLDYNNVGITNGIRIPFNPRSDLDSSKEGFLHGLFVADLLWNSMGKGGVFQMLVRLACGQSIDEIDVGLEPGAEVAVVLLRLCRCQVTAISCLRILW